MLKRKHSRLSILSLLLSVAMLLSCLTVVMIPASAEGATYESDEAAVAAGYVFRVDGLYYQTLAESYDAVANGGTIYMIGDYNHTGSCMDMRHFRTMKRSCPLRFRTARSLQCGFPMQIRKPQSSAC